jgi:hypothetical protein
MAKAKQVETKITEPQDTTTEQPQLTIADLQLIGRVIDTASQRGAFRASELADVGSIYNKLASFLSYIESVQPATESTTA